MEELVERMRVYGDQVRMDLRMAMHVRRTVVQLIEKFLEERDDDKKRIAIERIKNQMEKEVGPWFWRLDKGSPIESQLLSRASQLKSMGYSIQWQWDLLVECMTDWAGEADTALIERIIQEVHRASNAAR